MSQPTSALTHPVSMDYRGQRLGPGGSEARHYQDGAGRLANLSYGPMDNHLLNRTVKDKTGHYDWTTNGTSTYHSSQTMSEWVDGDTGVNQLLIGMTPAPNDPLESDHRQHGQHMFGVSQLNQLMRYDPTWREVYGKIRNADELMTKHFNYLGPQKVEQNDLVGRGGADMVSDEQVYTVFGRHSMPNIWLASGTGHVGVGMTCQLLVRRHRFVENAYGVADRATDHVTMARLGQKQRREDEDTESHAKRQRVEEYPAFQQAADAIANMFDDCTGGEFAAASAPLQPSPDCGKRATSVELGLDWDKDDTTDPNQEFYWSLDTYVSRTRTQPPPSLYNNANGEGTWHHVGLVSHLVGDGSSDITPASQKMAHQALYPTSRGKEYQNSLYGLSQVELMVRVGQVGF